jgi:hypothetical protein
VEWANESFAITIRPDVGYCVVVGNACEYEADNRELDNGEPKKVVVIDDAYLDMHAPNARQRIVMAGVRLAGLLNPALGEQAPEEASPSDSAARSDRRDQPRAC